MSNYKPRKCVWCGKEFVPKSSKQQSCGDIHYSKCPDCGKEIPIKEKSYANFLKDGPRRCDECRGKAIGNTRKNKSPEEKRKIQNKIEETNLAKYGFKNPMQNKGIKAKADVTVKDKYGVENVSQSKEIQDKIKENSLKKYGVDHYSQAPEIRERMVQGMIDKFGVINPAYSEEIQEKKTKTLLDKYGVDNPAKSEIVKAKMRQTCQDKFGFDYAAQAPEIIEKRTKTNLAKYNAPAYIFSKDFIRTLVTDPTKFNEYEKFIENPKLYILSTFNFKPTYTEISNKIGISESTICAHIIKNGLKYLINLPEFTMEEEIIQKLGLHHTEYEKHIRSIISPYEIDIYIPKYRIGIECDATATHNSSIPFALSDEITSPSYHKMKTDLAEKEGIFLFHIFGYEWSHRRNVIISMLKNLLSMNNETVYARKCKLVEVSNNDSIKFLNKNHLQGYTSSSVRLGLEYNGEIVSLMTFNKMRNTIGRSNTTTDSTWELSRFCSKLNTNVVGGASKLFQHFIKNYKYDSIISFSDRSHTKGGLYNKLGFRQEHITEPGYVWVDYKTDKYLNRVQCQKQNLRNLFKDDSIDTEHKTEREIMIERGFVQVYDSGKIKWIYDSLYMI